MFEQLNKSAINNELILIDGGMCNWHFNKKKSQITIYEIISIRKGAGKKMLNLLIDKATTLRIEKIVAKCPQDLASNKWYEKNGFKICAVTPVGKNGRLANIWVKIINKKGFL